jgi:hypothetical protein
MVAYKAVGVIAGLKHGPDNGVIAKEDVAWSGTTAALNRFAARP